MITKNYSFLAFFILVFYWTTTIYKPFLLDMAIASLLSIASANLHAYFIKKTHNEVTASILITLIMTSLLFGPIIYFVVIISSAIGDIKPEFILNVINTASNHLPSFLVDFEDKIKEFIASLDIKNLSKNVITIFGGIGAKSAIFIKDTIFILIFFFFFHLYGKQILLFIKENLLFDQKSVQTIFDEISTVMSITTYSILITAIFEGFLFGLALYFLGYDPVLFGILYGFASLIPVVGGVIMWLPVSMYEIYSGNVSGAIFVIIYSIVIISIIADTFIKPLIINFVNNKLVGKQANINSLVIFFAIVAGLSTYGFWGMILGPAVTALFVAMVIANKELKDKV